MQKMLEDPLGRYLLGLPVQESEKPERELAINADDVTNLKIALATAASLDDLLNQI